MSANKRVALSLLALVSGLVLIVVALRALPPSREEQLATAQRLEGLLVVMDELGLDGWHDCTACQPIDIRPGSSPAPLPAGQTVFGTMKAATAGVVPGGRLVEITTLSPAEGEDPASAAGGRVVKFTAVARSMLGGETGHDLWHWTWYEEPQSPGPLSLGPHWEFEAVSAPKED
jgi:hypothetical protein